MYWTSEINWKMDGNLEMNNIFWIIGVVVVIVVVLGFLGLG
ncbi:MAG: hypothetical protein WAS73_14895 [Defluviicoccus sp.]